LVGNIGTPPFDALSEINNDSIIVFELSAQQLEDISVSPHIGLLLNLFDEHLDRYETAQTYHNAKFQLIRKFAKNDTLIFNIDDPKISDYIDDRIITMSYSMSDHPNADCSLHENKIIMKSDTAYTELVTISDDLKLRGRHNTQNIMAAVLACISVNISIDNIVDGIISFNGLPHRLEYAGEYRNIKFYNDSIATVPEATIEAILSLMDVDTLILGGFDRMLDYAKLYQSLDESGIRNILFMGPAGERMRKEYMKFTNSVKQLISIQNLNDAFEIIPAITTSGKTCLMSPAAASYDSFVNFEERGELFKKLARSL